MICTTPQRDFITGEQKYIDFRMESHSHRAITITDADYTLYNGEQIVATGKCKIDGKYVSVLLKAPDKTGTYLLEMRYTVPPETRKLKVVINVH